MEINFKEIKGYKKQHTGSLVTNIAVSLVIFFVVIASSNQYYAIAISVFFFIVQQYKSNRWERYFISRIIISHDKITIEYSDKDEKKELSDFTNSIKFEKKLAFNKIKTPYLAVYHNNVIVIKQFALPEWSEKKIDEVIFMISENNIEGIK